MDGRASKIALQSAGRGYLSRLGSPATDDLGAISERLLAIVTPGVGRNRQVDGDTAPNPAGERP